MGGCAKEDEPLKGKAGGLGLGAGLKLGVLLLAASLALCLLLLLQQRRPTGTVLESYVSSRVVDGKPVFDWKDTHNVNMFNVACANGNMDACKQLASNQDALDNLNMQARVDKKWNYDIFRNVPENDNHHEWDNSVPLDGAYDMNELQGSDMGNFVPEDQVAFKHNDDDLKDQEIERTIQHDQVSYPRGPHLKVFGGQQLSDSWQLGGLRLMVPGGLAQQQGIQGVTQSLMVDLCNPRLSAFCGPLRPEDAKIGGSYGKDYKADVVLTEPDEYGGWMNVQYECCPCLGKGSRRIGYDQFEHNGYYNPYTMNLCRVCAGCSR